jgi:hypothetical protein
MAQPLVNAFGIEIDTPGCSRSAGPSQLFARLPTAADAFGFFKKLGKMQVNSTEAPAAPQFFRTHSPCPDT